MPPPSHLGNGGIIEKPNACASETGIRKEILRKIRGLRYFDDADILFNWEDTLKGVPLRTMKKVVNLAKMRRLYKRADGHRDGHEREDGGEV